MELSRDEIIKLIKQKEILKEKLEITFNQITGQIQLLREFLKKEESTETK